MHTAERFFVIGRSLLLFTHTCPITGFAVASHLNTANSCCHRVFLRHFRFRKCYPRTVTLSFPHLHEIPFSYSYHDADTIFPVSFIFTASSFRAPCLLLLDRNGPNVSSRSRRTIYIQTKPPECSSLFYIIPTRSPRFAQKTIFCNENSNFINFPYYFQLCHRLYPLLQISSVIC